MDREQQIKIINGEKTTVVNSTGRAKIKADTVTGLTHSDLEVGYGGEFEAVLPKEYVYFTKYNRVEVYVPIRVKILYEINKTKESIGELRETKLFIKQKAIELENNLKGAIGYMQKIEELYTPKLDDEQDEFLNVLRVNDGCKDERALAIKSYASILGHTEETLDSMKTRYDSQKKDIIKKGISTVSNILKERGVRNHRVEAIRLMSYNNVDVPARY